MRESTSRPFIEFPAARGCAKVVILAVTDPFVGTIPGWITLIGVGIVAWLLYRGGTGTAVGGLQDTNRELERQIRERDGKISALERINAELRATKDVSIAILPVIESMKGHEVRAQERHEGSMKVLALIAERLGPDPNGH